jgi:hypothetical protein
MMVRSVPKYIVVVQYNPYETSAFGFATLKEARSNYAEMSAKYHTHLTKVIE